MFEGSIFIAQQGFEVLDSLAGKGKTSLIAISFVVAGFAILKTAFKTDFRAVPVLATAFVGGVVIWFVSGGYVFVDEVVEDEAQNISEDIRGVQ